MKEMAPEVQKLSRKQTLLLYFAGETINEIFDELPNTTAIADENPFERAVEALTNYFILPQNFELEVYILRRAKQDPLIVNHGISHQIKPISTHL